MPRLWVGSDRSASCAAAGRCPRPRADGVPSVGTGSAQPQDFRLNWLETLPLAVCCFVTFTSRSIVPLYSVREWGTGGKKL